MPRGVPRQAGYEKIGDLRVRPLNLDRSEWVFEDIGNPDRLSWDCPECRFPNGLDRGLLRCAGTGCEHVLDQDRVRYALAVRRQRL